MTTKQVLLNFHCLELCWGMNKALDFLDPCLLETISISISDIYIIYNYYVQDIFIHVYFSILYNCFAVCQSILLRISFLPAKCSTFSPVIKDCSWTGTSCEKKVSLAKAVCFMEI